MINIKNVVIIGQRCSCTCQSKIATMIIFGLFLGYFWVIFGLYENSKLKLKDSMPASVG
jgi:hypothetical protein